MFLNHEYMHNCVCLNHHNPTISRGIQLVVCYGRRYPQGLVVSIPGLDDLLLPRFAYITRRASRYHDRKTLLMQTYAGKKISLGNCP